EEGAQALIEALFEGAEAAGRDLERLGRIRGGRKRGGGGLGDLRRSSREREKKQPCPEHHLISPEGASPPVTIAEWRNTLLRRLARSTSSAARIRRLRASSASCWNAAI